MCASVQKAQTKVDKNKRDARRDSERERDIENIEKEE